jgi:hypothetical protein
MDEGESWRRIARDEDGESERRSDACNCERARMDQVGVFRTCLEDEETCILFVLDSPRDGPLRSRHRIRKRRYRIISWWKRHPKTALDRWRQSQVVVAQGHHT